MYFNCILFYCILLYFILVGRGPTKQLGFRPLFYRIFVRIFYYIEFYIWSVICQRSKIKDGKISCIRSTFTLNLFSIMGLHTIRSNWRLLQSMSLLFFHSFSSTFFPLPPSNSVCSMPTISHPLSQCSYLSYTTSSSVDQRI